MEPFVQYNVSFQIFYAICITFGKIPEMEYSDDEGKHFLRVWVHPNGKRTVYVSPTVGKQTAESICRVVEKRIGKVPMFV